MIHRIIVFDFHNFPWIINFILPLSTGVTGFTVVTGFVGGFAVVGGLIKENTGLVDSR